MKRARKRRAVKTGMGLTVMASAVKVNVQKVIVQKANDQKLCVMTAHAAIMPHAMAPIAMEPVRLRATVTQNPTAVSAATGRARLRAAMRRAVPMVIVPAAIAVSAALAVSAPAALARDDFDGPLRVTGGGQSTVEAVSLPLPAAPHSCPKAARIPSR